MNPLRSWARRLPQLRRDAAYLLLAWPLHLLAYCLVVPLVCLGVGTVVIWVGLLVLVLALLVASGFAGLARRAAGAVEGATTPVPGHYLRAAEDAGWLRRMLTPLKDPQRWMDVLWAVVSFPVSLVVWALTVAWLAIAVGGPLAPIAEVILELSLPEERMNLAELLGLRPALLWMILLDLTVALIFAATAPAVLRALASALSGLTRLMLSWRGEVGRLETSRAAAQRAEADTRRRLERDIHDGPQQRLVRLGMDLARAKRQASRDPRAAEAILTEAIDQTKETLSELRNLSRGIAPPVLVDRGLAAALEESAARSCVPVTVSVAVPRLAEHVEQAAYFVASETLANVNKHSGASTAELGAVVDGPLLRLWVTDNGVGGASLDKGHGLAGLAQRLQGVDGRLAISSPPGGPTTIQAVIPCES